MAGAKDTAQVARDKAREYAKNAVPQLDPGRKAVLDEIVRCFSER